MIQQASLFLYDFSDSCFIFLVFQKKEWLCLNCQTQRALSGSLGDIPAPMAQPMGSPRASAPSNQQTAQQKSPSHLSGPRATVPQQQQKPTGSQVSGPLSNGKEAEPASQTKRFSQTSPQTKCSTQPTSHVKGQTQPSAQSRGPAQAKGPNMSHAQSKPPTQPANQTKGPGQVKGLTQTKGSAQPSAQTKGSSSSSGAKTSSSLGKASASNAKTTTTPSKTTPTQSKPTGISQARKQPQSQEKTKVAPKSLKEDVKVSTKKTLSENLTSPKERTISEDAQKSRHHEVSYLQLLRLYLLLLTHHFHLILCFSKARSIFFIILSNFVSYYWNCCFFISTHLLQ